MASQSPEAFYAALRDEPKNPIKFGKAQAVVQTPAGEPDQQLKLPNDEEAAQLLKAADDGAPYPAPAKTRPNAGVVYSAAANVLSFQGGLLGGRPPVVTYEPELVHTTWQFPTNAEGADVAAQPIVSPSLSENVWDASIKADLQRQSDSGVPRLLLFVHGFNTLPREANDTAHRILQPVGANGGLGVQAVVSFTWDSNGRALSYPYEEHMAECGGLSDHLADLIRRLLRIKLDDDKHWQLIILAHSMGHRPTTAALRKVYNDEDGKAALQLNTPDLPMLVINAAADIDASSYSHLMAPVMSLLGDAARAIVLASTHDIILVLSYLVHDRPNEEDGKEQRTGLLYEGLDLDWQKNIHDYQVTRLVDRSGLFDLIQANAGSLPAVVKVPNLDVIDCSVASQVELGRNGNGHGYYMSVESVRAEIVAAMDTPSTAQRLQYYNQEQHPRIAAVPANTPPLPFVLFDDPMYKLL